VSERAAALADDFEQAVTSLIGLVEGLSEAQWATRTDAEGWTVAATTRHIAWGYDFLGVNLDLIANGERPGDPGDIHAQNAQHAEQFADVPRDEVLGQLRTTSVARADRIRGYSDAQIDRSFTVPIPNGPTMTVAGLIQNALIGHVNGHASSIRTTLGL
jgi:uncharacterized protein (TIGR03083 family)